MGEASWIDILEAAYDVDAGEDRWLGQIARAGEKLLDDGGGVFAFVYDASAPERLRIDRFVHTRADAPLDAASALRGIEAVGGGPAYVRATFRSLAAATVRTTPGFEGSPTAKAFDAAGVGDVVVVNGLDPGGVGVLLGAITRERRGLSRAQRERLERVATHLANSHRLRRRLASACGGGAGGGEGPAPWNADAVLTPRGKLEHAGHPQAHDRRSREALRAAAVAIDRARGRLRRIDADSALGRWMGLVDGRWSLVDKFDGDGKHYVLARRNEPRVAGLDSLSERERAVAAYAAMGHTNKMIAYDLGIAHSTVRVLLARAASKLGVRTREELVRVVRAATDPAA